MHQPLPVKPTKNDRATMQRDFHFMPKGYQPLFCFRVSAEGVDPAGKVARGIALIADRRAEWAADELRRTVNDYRLKRANGATNV